MKDCDVCGLPNPARSPYWSGNRFHGMDLSNGVETHVEAIVEDGVYTITDIYEIVDHVRNP
tara:strand:+ start:648 stop:830 length:183 start_codon:yes stop_codon:yes gene_type:complete